jgi:hypothetical protein
VDILLLCIIALVCGVEDIENITFFGITRLSWLNQYLALPNGIPSADTIRRLLARMTAKSSRLVSWTGPGDTSKSGRERGGFSHRRGLVMQDRLPV